MTLLIAAIVGGLCGAGVGLFTLRYGMAWLRAAVWSEGYWTGVADQQTAEDVAMPGYGPNRVNPYLDWRTRLPYTMNETFRSRWAEWKARRWDRRFKHRMAKR